MTNPMDALVSLQAALDAGTVLMRACDIHPDLKVLLDHPAGEPRFTYARVVAGIVQSIALLHKGPLETASAPHRQFARFLISAKDAAASDRTESTTSDVSFPLRFRIRP